MNIRAKHEDFKVTTITEESPFIFIENERILLKVDAQGFVAIGETVVGHEPGLPRLIEMWKEQAKKGFSDSEFNPDEPFEISHDGEKWESVLEGSKYVGVYHGVEYGHGVTSVKYIRNVKKPEFEQGQPVWGKQKNCNHEGVWLFGTFEETKDGCLIINHQNQCPLEVIEIRPFFVGGVAQYPPFKDRT